MVEVKICGITNIKDAREAVECGAWALGFNFYKKSPRYIVPVKAKKIIDQLPRNIVTVGVFVNEQESLIKRIEEYCHLQMLQFHGEETPQFCLRFPEHKIIKAFRIRPEFDVGTVSYYKTDYILFDAFKKDIYGGSGQVFDWDLVRDNKKIQVPVILSGGLNPANVAQAIKEVKPFAVDVASGVEKMPGKKDFKLLKEFFKAVGGKDG